MKTLKTRNKTKKETVDIHEEFIPYQNPEVPGMILSEKNKREIDAAVKKTVKEYGQTLRLLGNG